MKNRFLKGILSVAMFSITAVAMAETPIDHPGGEDPTGVNIDANLVILVAVALAFGTYIVSKKIKAVKN